MDSIRCLIYPKIILNPILSEKKTINQSAVNERNFLYFLFVFVKNFLERNFSIHLAIIIIICVCNHRNLNSIILRHVWRQFCIGFFILASSFFNHLASTWTIEWLERSYICQSNIFPFFFSFPSIIIIVLLPTMVAIMRRRTFFASYLRDFVNKPKIKKNMLGRWGWWWTKNKKLKFTIKCWMSNAECWIFGC